jgi:beta-phosphoglucomutase-like phosphatase (HAD superfamily)
MSYREEALHVLRALDLEKELDVVLTREDVERAKPDPEIYLLVAQKLGVPPEECMALEDSPNGVRAAVDAGMNVIAVATPFTIAGIHSSEVLEHAWVVHEPEQLPDIVRRRIEEHNRTAH